MKEQIIKQLKNKEAPEGFSLSGRVHRFFQDIISLTPGLTQGVLARKEAQKDLPMEKQYIHRISDTAGIQLVVTMLPHLTAKMHTVRASLHDNTYKRTFGKWKEWEVVVWDDCLDMCVLPLHPYLSFANVPWLIIRHYSHTHLLQLGVC